ncbi:MFS transporter [Clostridium frigidicarnis]|uniref:Na+/melibiose symporter n=1 Tax=Clostridium frigidicarnis TaxID=84698 RepID=A0A1I1AXT0_9CLOT|nr:MFS transporter [Clostridium frigidicarnis]SFB42895.1 Na+/melibiose symporter [Clostridium frigidicarnis]
MKFGLLKKKDFSLLMLGKLVSFVGTQMQSFALSLYVLSLTGSATKFASVLAITLVPQLILGPIAGVFVDWVSKKKIIVYLDILNGVLIGIYAIIYKINGGLELWQIYTLTIVLAVISLIFNPAISTVIPTIVKKEDLVDANGINSFIINIGMVAAPAIAGILFGLYGLAVILVVNSFSFILSAISEIFINIPLCNTRPKKINFKSFYHDFSEGIKFIKNNEDIYTIIILALVINFGFTPIGEVGLAYISKEVIKVSDLQYGMLQSILVTSMMISPFICSRISKKMGLGKILFYNIFISSILIGILGIVPSNFYLGLFQGNFFPYVSFIIINFIICLILSIVNIALNAMIQEKIPLPMMGRVMAVMTTGCMAAVPLGQLIFGFLFDKIETWICIEISAVLILVSILMFKKLLLKNIDIAPDANNDNLSMDSHCVSDIK